VLSKLLVHGFSSLPRKWGRFRIAEGIFHLSLTPAREEVMFEMTRRNFLQVSSGVFAASIFGGLSARDAVKRSVPVKIFTILFGTAPSTDDTDLRPMSHEDMIRRLKADCPEVNFVVRDVTGGNQLESILKESEELGGQGYDGVIVYGWPRHYDLLRTGLPTINISVINDFMNNPFPMYRENRVIGAFLDPWAFSVDPDIREQMFVDLVDKIRLIGMLKRMKSEHILTVTDSEYVNVTYGDLLRNMPADYNERILSAIESTFGTKVTKIGSREVTEDKDIQSLWRDDSPEANQIARRWIQNAEKMINTIESEVVRSAKVYLAMKMLMQKYGSTAMAFHIRTLTKDPRPEDLVFPALATSEFQLQNIVAKCQSHLNIILSEMLLQYAYGRPSMLGDYAVDPYNNTSMVQHCEGPWNPWGDERRVPYIINDHRERRIRGRATTGVGAGSWILYPGGEAVTMWQIDVESKDVLLHTGPTVPMLHGSKRYRDHLYEMM